MSHPGEEGRRRRGNQLFARKRRHGLGKVEESNILGVESGTIQDYATSQIKLQNDISPAKIIVMGLL